MRPVLRGDSPIIGDFDHYRDAYKELVSRNGKYCSYCERRIATNLAVEHILPKDGLYGHPNLERRWENLLLGCVNCNSTKGAKEVVIANLLLPDRDNTAAAYQYTMDGKISLATGLSATQQESAKSTLSLVGLDKELNEVNDSNGKLVAIDRVAQRMEVWLIAQESKNELQANLSDGFRRQIARTAIGHGFFSIWMKVFHDDISVRKLLIEKFVGTAADCFDPNTTLTVSPRPANGLAYGSKL